MAVDQPFPLKKAHFNRRSNLSFDKNTTYEFYIENGIPKDVSGKIAEAYEISTQMLREFREGKPCIIRGRSS